jgi:hypothetical protein
MVLFGDGGGKRGGNACVDRIAALRQQAESGFDF